MSLDLSRIGRVLKETREAKGLKLEDVSASLYLRKTIIDALESGNWDKLPHQVYVKGYLNQYASYLNIEEQVTSAIQPQQEVQPRDEEMETPQIAPAKAKQNHNMSRAKYVAQKMRALYPKRGFVIYGAGAVILIAFLAYQNMSRPHYLPTAAGTYAVSNTAYETTTKSVEHPTAPVLELKKLVIVCKERTWIRIVIDQTEKKEFMLNPEEMVAFNAKEGFDLLIGNAGGVSLFYNGNNMGFQGENGEVKRVRLP